MSAEAYTKKMGAGRSGLALGGALLAAAVIAAAVFMGSGGSKIDVIRPERREIRESFREPAKTRLENTWTIAAQVAGRIGRIQLEPGDAVKAGQTLAEYDLLPLESAVEEADARVRRLKAQLTLIEDSSVEQADLAAAEARARSSEDRIKAAEAQIQAAKARVTRTEKDLVRARDLVAAGALDPQTLDAQEMAATEAREALKQAEAELAATLGTASADRSGAQVVEKGIGRKSIERRQIVASLAEAEAQLEKARHDLELAKITSPIDGVVLERYERGEKPVAQGTPLLLLGDPAQIEVVADVLTEDALKLKTGDEVALEALSGERLLGGSVKRIEPQGFTKLSSLGVEQQRVNVIVTLERPSPELGVGFRLHARFFTGTRSGALVVPRYTVLQAPDQSYYVLAVQNGRLRRIPVRPGLKSDLTIEIVEGLDENTEVVASPDSTLEEGTAVKPKRVPFS